MEVETVRVKSSHPDHEQGFFTINKSDFDAEVHTLWLDEAEAAAAEEDKRAEAEQAAAASKAAQPDASTATSSMSGKVTAPRR